MCSHREATPTSIPLWQLPPGLQPLLYPPAWGRLSVALWLGGALGLATPPALYIHWCALALSMANDDRDGKANPSGCTSPPTDAAKGSPATAVAPAVTSATVKPTQSALSAPYEGKAKPPSRGRNYALFNIDPAALAAAGVDASACLTVEVESRDTLFCAVVDYAAAMAADATSSLWLQPGVWRENEVSDPGWDVVDLLDGTAAPERGDELDFDPIYSAGPGVVRLPTPDGSAVWAAVGVNRHIPSGPTQRVLCLYSPLGKPAGGTVVEGAEAGASEYPGDRDDKEGASTQGESPTAVARARLSAFITTVLKWRRDTEAAKAKVHTFRLWRFQLVDDLNGRWRSQGIHLTRRVETVILDVAIRDRLLNDARAFDTTAALRWYTRHGLPYRRCYLLHGPPGTGKSSFVRVLAGELKRSISFLQCSNPKMSDQILADAFRDCPSKTILVLEDLDCLFQTAAGGVGARESRQSVSISLSGILNSLDGLVSGTKGRITILSSNHPQLLDSALVRSGRVDMCAEFALPTRADVATLFSSFYPDEPMGMATRFADTVFAAATNSVDRTMATLQQLFIKHRAASAATVIADVKAFMESRQSGPGTANGVAPGVYV